MSDVVLQLAPYMEVLKKAANDEIYSTPEASVRLPFDGEVLKRAISVADKVNNNSLKYVVVVGIGGSNLGAQAIYEAIRLKLQIALSHSPRIIFADTNNPREAEALAQFIGQKVHSKDEIVLNIITKSGTTSESVANASFLLEILKNKFGDADALSRVVVTTDENSALWKIAIDKKIEVLPIPKMVGGRYSVFSCVGIFPLLLAGINVQELLAGARESAEKCYNGDIIINPGLVSASTLFLSLKKGIAISNCFLFHSELEGVGKWWRQLTAESLGKNGLGVTPIVSIGSTDLHSMVQLYFGGPQDKFTNFVYAADEQYAHALVPKESIFESLSPDIRGKDFADIMKAILMGTEEAYKENKMPFIETILPDISERSIGAFMQMKMIETMLLAKLWNINAFDQPEVENYKKHTKELLKK